MPTPIRREPTASPSYPRHISFDHFDLDSRSCELRKNGSRIKLQPQPFQLLCFLLRNAGEVVTREEICRELWPADTFVDFEHSLTAAINKIREALNDSAERPKYVETLPKLGYRFIGKIKYETPVVTRVWESKPALESTPDLPVRFAHFWYRAAVLLALAAVLILAVFLARPSRNSSSDLLALTAVPFTSYPGQETAASLSPDGSHIAFSWDGDSTNKTGVPAYDLYVKTIGSETLLRLTNHPSQWISSAWSPDGTQIAFHRLAGPDTGIYVVPALGGPERKLHSTRAPYYLASELNWSPDGKWIAYADVENGPGDRMFLLNTETLEVHEFPHDPSCNHEGTLTFSSSGKQLAMLCVHSTTSFEYFVSNLDGTSKRALVKFPQFPTSLGWTGDDQCLILSRKFETGAELYRIRVSDGALSKIPVTPTGDWPAVSRDGKKIAFTSSTYHTNIWRRDLLHPETPPLQVYPSTLQQSDASYSPDGKHVAFDSARSGIWSVWVADVDGGNLQQVSHDHAAGGPRWSPDSSKIVFQMEEQKGIYGIYVASLTDLVPRKLNTGISPASSPAWSHDGKWIYFRGYADVGHQIFRCPAEGGPPTLLAMGQDINSPIESPDGNLLYLASRGLETPLISLSLEMSGATSQPVPDIPNVLAKSMWTVVPTGIYFVPAAAPRTLSFYDFSSRKIRSIFHINRDFSDGLAVSPDGRYLLYSQLDERNSDIMLISIGASFTNESSHF